MSKRSEIAELADILAPYFGTTGQQILADIAKKKQQRVRRVALNNARFEASVKQGSSEKSDALVRDGYRIIRTFTSRTTGRVAVMLQKDKVWDSAKGRIGTALAIVYPDGSVSKTMEKRISLRQDF